MIKRMKKTVIHTLMFTTMLWAATGAGAAPMGTAFTYQGRLYDGGVPVSGTYIFRFSLYDSANAATPLTPTPPADNPVAASDVWVTNGLFTTAIDFGVNMFTGPARWLGIEVRTNSNSSAFAALDPRQELKPAPYALYAASADTASSVSLGGITASGLAAGAVGSVAIADGSITPVDLSPALLGNTFWRLDGNGGTTAANFLGTTDNTNLVMKVNNETVMRYQPHSGAPVIVGGDPGNYIDAGAGGAVIAGGGSTRYGVTNEIWSDGAAIVGGVGNYVSGRESFIGGGWGNKIAHRPNRDLQAATIGGGTNNFVDIDYGFVGGGRNNSVSGESSSVSGGDGNRASALQSTVGGGWHNVASGWASVVAGGYTNAATGQSSSVGGGYLNHASSLWSTIAGGTANTTLGNQSSIGGGIYNLATATSSTIAGGESNTNLTTYGTIGGGALNYAQAPYSTTIGGGFQNTVRGQDATIGGGSYNTVSSLYATIAGGTENIVSTNATGGIIAGGLQNRIEPLDFGANIGVVNPDAATIAGGAGNRIQGGTDAVIAGGRNNLISDSGLGSAVVGGTDNQINAPYSGALGQGAIARAPHSLTFGKQFAAAGDAQGASYVGTVQTVGNNAGIIQGPRLTIGSAISFTGVIAAKAFGDASAGFEVKGLIRNYGTEVALVGTPTVTVLGRDVITSATVTVDLSAAVGGALIFRVQSGSDLNVRWVAHLQTAEVQF